MGQETKLILASMTFPYLHLPLLALPASSTAVSCCSSPFSIFPARSRGRWNQVCRNRSGARYSLLLHLLTGSCLGYCSSGLGNEDFKPTSGCSAGNSGKATLHGLEASGVCQGRRRQRLNHAVLLRLFKPLSKETLFASSSSSSSPLSSSLRSLCVRRYVLANMTVAQLQATGSPPRLLWKTLAPLAVATLDLDLSQNCQLARTAWSKETCAVD